jgi:peptide/nickel transport system permease protein
MRDDPNTTLPAPPVGLFEQPNATLRTDSATAVGPGVAGRSVLGYLWRRLAVSRTTMAGMVICLVVVFVAALAPVIAPYDPLYLQPDGLRGGRPITFDARRWLGTDTAGRDFMSRLIFGARISVLVGVVGNGFATILGLVLGGAAGYFRGGVETIIMRLADTFMSIPYLLFAMVLAAVVGPGLAMLIFVIAAFLWTYPARVFYGQVLSIREKEFVEAARATGDSDIRILFRHILPQLTSTFLVYVTLGISGAIITEASLSYLGLGVQPPAPSWGNMVSEGQTYYSSDPRLVLLPGLAITITVIGFALLGDGLRDALDPRHPG